MNFHSSSITYGAGSSSSTTLNTAIDGTFTINSPAGGLSISSSSSGSSGPVYTSGGTYYQHPFVNTDGAITINNSPHDELKSAPKEAGPTSHSLRGILRIYGDSVVVEYFCTHCEEVIHRQVISKVPEELTNKKCLPRIVDGV